MKMQKYCVTLVYEILQNGRPAFEVHSGLVLASNEESALMKAASCNVVPEGALVFQTAIPCDKITPDNSWCNKEPINSGFQE
jgi:hypothetical protein